MRQFRPGRMFSALLVVACGHETFDLLPNDTVPLDSHGGAENTGGRDLPGAAGIASAGVPDISGNGGSSDGFGGEPQAGQGGEPQLPPPSFGGGPEHPGSGGAPDWVPPMAGAPGDGHCDGPPPPNECFAFAPVCIRCNPDQPERDRDCFEDPRVPYCDPASYRCVECVPPNGPDLGTQNCPPDFACILGTCRPRCDSPGLPACPPHLPSCDPRARVCSECVAHEECRGPTTRNKICVTGTCVECVTNYDCFEYATPICDEWKCRPCVDDCECGGGKHCSRETGACVPG
jgi:hypothetical protein